MRTSASSPLVGGDDVEAGLAEEIGDVREYQRLILDDEDRGRMHRPVIHGVLNERLRRSVPVTARGQMGNGAAKAQLLYCALRRGAAATRAAILRGRGPKGLARRRTA